MPAIPYLFWLAPHKVADLLLFLHINATSTSSQKSAKIVNDKSLVRSVSWSRIDLFASSTNEVHIWNAWNAVRHSTNSPYENPTSTSTSFCM